MKRHLETALLLALVAFTLGALVWLNGVLCGNLGMCFDW